jgi:hypothetical protein
MMAETKRSWCIHHSSMTKGEPTRKKIIAATPIFTHGYESQKVSLLSKTGPSRLDDC